MNNENYTDLFLLDPSQKEFLKLSHKEQFIRLVSLSESSALEAIGKFIKYELYLHKKCILVVDNDAAQNRILQFLGDKKLSKYCLNLSSQDAPFTEKDRVRLKLWCKKSDIPNQTGRELLVWNKIRRKKQQIQEAYSNLNKRIFGEQSWSELVDRAGMISGNIQFTLSHEQSEPVKFSFTPEEFWLIKGKIQKLKQCFNPAFPEIDEKFPFQAQLFHQHDSLEIVKDLQDYLQKLDQCIHQLANFLRLYKLDLEKIWRTRYRQFYTDLNLLDEYLDELEWYNERPALQLSQKLRSVFKAHDLSSTASMQKLNELLLRIESMAEQCLGEEGPVRVNELDLALTESEEIEELVNYWKHLLDSWDEIMQKSIQTHLNRLSSYNSEDKKLSRLESEIEKLIGVINQSKIFTKSLENHSLSCQIRLKKLQQYRLFLKRSSEVLEKNPKYAAWHSEKYSLNSSAKKLLDMLISLDPEHWIPAFEYWYIQQLIHNHARCNIPLDDKILLDWNRLWDEANQEMERIADYQWSEIRGRAVSNLKTTQKTIYISLFKKNQMTDFRWIDLLMADAKSFSDIYPVLLVNQNTLENFNVLSHEAYWDHIVYLQIGSKKEVESKLTKKISGSAIVNYNLEQKHKLESESSNWKGPEIHLLESLYDRSDGSSHGLVDYLHLSKTLASHLFSTASKGRIFQLKNVLIISYLSSLQNKILLKNLNEAGVKELNLKQDFEQSLQDSLIDQDRQWVIFTRDGLLNTRDLSHFDWQLKLMQFLRTKGVIFYHQWSLQNRLNWGAKLSKQCKEINRLNQDNITPVEQQDLEAYH